MIMAEANGFNQSELGFASEITLDHKLKGQKVLMDDSICGKCGLPEQVKETILCVADSVSEGPPFLAKLRFTNKVTDRNGNHWVWKETEEPVCLENVKESGLKRGMKLHADIKLELKIQKELMGQEREDKMFVKEELEIQAELMGKHNDKDSDINDGEC